MQFDDAAAAGVAVEAAMHAHAGLAQGPGDGIAGVEAGRVLPVDPVHGAAVGVQGEDAGRVGQGAERRRGIRRYRGAGEDRIKRRRIRLHRGPSLYPKGDGLRKAPQRRTPSSPGVGLSVLPDLTSKVRGLFASSGVALTSPSSRYDSVRRPASASATARRAIGCGRRVARTVSAADGPMEMAGEACSVPASCSSTLTASDTRSKRIEMLL